MVVQVFLAARDAPRPEHRSGYGAGGASMVRRAWRVRRLCVGRCVRLVGAFHRPVGHAWRSSAAAQDRDSPSAFVFLFFVFVSARISPRFLAAHGLGPCLARGRGSEQAS